ncbi:hypothetical protein QJS04_geneDACA005100 [Acorus gramineus]|uniref:Titin-like n=1 Tax=Acorus gramineus TaxID=55184 RepID=A0AAV9AUY7_ACOGR|nr:hypothetical protein QJS04_geneDACA005100 [Acorus gramineus]
MEVEVERPETISEKNFLKFEDGNSSSSNAAVYVSEELKVAPESNNISSETAMEGTAKSVGEGITSFSEGGILVEPPSHVDVVMKENGEAPKMVECIKSTVSIENEPLENEDLSQNLDISDVGDENCEIVKHDQSLEAKEFSEDKNPATDDLGEKDHILSIIKASKEPSIETVASYEIVEKDVEIKDVKPSPHTIQLLDEETNLQKDISEDEKPQEACDVTSEEKNLKNIEMCEISLQNEELDSEVGKISELASQSPISCGSESAEKEISNASSSGLSLTVDAEKLTATNLEEKDTEVTDVGEDMVKDDLNEKHITHVTPVNVIPAEEISEYHERFELEEQNSEENKMGRGTDGESKNEEIEIPTVQKNACGPSGSLAKATKLEEQNAEVTDIGEGTVKDIISDGQIPTIQAKELPEDHEELESEEVNTESVDLGGVTVNNSGNAEKEIPTEVQSDAFASGPNPDTDAEKLTETKLEDQNTKATDMGEVIVKDDFNDVQIPHVEPVAEKEAKEILQDHEGFKMEEQNSKETDMGEGRYDNRKKAEMEIPTEVLSDSCTSSESLANDAARTTATMLEEQNIEAADVGTVKDGSNDEQISAFPVDKLSEEHEQSELEEQNAEAVDLGLEIEDSKNVEQESPTARQSDPSASGLSPDVDAENLTATKLEEQNTELANVKESIVKDVLNDEQIPHVAPVSTIPPVDINVESVTAKDALHEEQVPHVGPVTKISAEETSGVHERYDVVEDYSFETRNEREEEAPEVNGNQPNNLDDPYVALEAQELPMQKEEIKESASMATEVVAEEKINSEVHETEKSSKRSLNEEETQCNDFGNLCAVQDPRKVSAETDEASKEVESEQLTRTSDAVSNSATAESSADSEATADENDINDKSPVLQSEEPQHEIIVGREINEDDIQIENEVQDNDQEASFVSETETESETKAQLQNKVEHNILEEPSLMASKNIEETSQDETQGESSGETKSIRTEILEVDNPVSGELNKVGTPHIEYEEVILETNETDGDFERKTSDEKNQAEDKIMLASALSSDEEITPREDSGKEIEEPIGRATEEQNPVKPESIEDVNLHASSMVPSTQELHLLEEETESEKISLSEISHEVPYAKYREDGTEDLKQKMEERIQEENKDEGHEASKEEPAEWNPDSRNDTTKENPISVEENLDNGGGHLPVTHALLARAFADENTDEEAQHIKDSSLVDEPIYETTNTKDDRGIDAFKVEMVPEKIERTLEPKDQVEVEPEEIERTSEPEDHDLKNTEEINEETSLEGSGIVVRDHDHEIVKGNIEMAAATENSKVEILDNDESDQKKMDQLSLSRDSVEEEREQENPRETYEAVTTNKENPISVELGSKPHMAHIEDDNMLAQNINDLPVSQVLLKYVSVEGADEIEEAHVGKQMREQNPDMILEEPSIIESKAFNIDTTDIETNTKESAIINVKTVSSEDSKFSERFHEYETEQMSADLAAQERSLGSIKNETPDDKAEEEPTNFQLSDIKTVASVENVEKHSANEDVATPKMMRSSNENEEIEDNGRLDKDLDASPVTMDCEKETTLKEEDEASAREDKILQKIDYSQEVSPSPTEPTGEEERDDRGLNPLTVEIEPEKIERAFGPHVQGEVEPEEIGRAFEPEDHDLKNIEEINEETTLAGGNMVVSNHDQAIVRENIEMEAATEYPEIEILVNDESQQNKMDQMSRDSIEEEKEQENPKEDCQEQKTIEESKQVESAVSKDNKISDPVVGKSSQMEENKDLGEHHEMDYQERDSATLEAHNVLDEEASKEINLEEPVLFNDDSSNIEDEMDMKENHANKLEETFHVKENNKKDLEERAGQEEPDDQNSEEIQNEVNPISVEEKPDKGGGHLPVTHALFAGAFADENTDAEATEDSSVIDEPTFETLNTNDDRGINALNMEMEPEKIERAFEPKDQVEMEPEEIKRASEHEDHDLKNIEKINEETTLEGGDMVVSNHDQAIMRENIEMAAAIEYPKVEILVNDESHQNEMDQQTLSSASFEEEKEQENPKEDSQEQETIEESKQAESAISKDNKTSDPVVGESSQMEETKDLGEHHGIDHKEKDSVTLEAHDLLDKEVSKEANTLDSALSNDEASKIEEEKDMEENNANKLEENIHVKESEEKDLEKNAGQPEPDDQNSEAVTADGEDPISVELGQKSSMLYVEDDNMLAQNIDHLPVSEVLLKYMSVEETSKEQTDEIAEVQSVGKQITVLNPDMILEESSIIESEAFNKGIEDIENDTKESAITNDTTVSIEHAEFSETFHEYETETTSSNQAAQERLFRSNKSEISADKTSNIADQAEVEPSVENVVTPEIDSITTGYVMVSPQDVESETVREEAEPESITGSKSDGSHKIMKDENTDIKVEDTKLACVEHDLEASRKTMTEISEILEDKFFEEEASAEASSVSEGKEKYDSMEETCLHAEGTEGEKPKQSNEQLEITEPKEHSEEEISEGNRTTVLILDESTPEGQILENFDANVEDTAAASKGSHTETHNEDKMEAPFNRSDDEEFQDGEEIKKIEEAKDGLEGTDQSAYDTETIVIQNEEGLKRVGETKEMTLSMHNDHFSVIDAPIEKTTLKNAEEMYKGDNDLVLQGQASNITKNSEETKVADSTVDASSPPQNINEEKMLDVEGSPSLFVGTTTDAIQIAQNTMVSQEGNYADGTSQMRVKELQALSQEEFETISEGMVKEKEIPEQTSLGRGSPRDQTKGEDLQTYNKETVSSREGNNTKTLEEESTVKVPDYILARDEVKQEKFQGDTEAAPKPRNQDHETYIEDATEYNKPKEKVILKKHKDRIFCSIYSFIL